MALTSPTCILRPIFSILIVTSLLVSGILLSSNNAIAETFMFDGSINSGLHVTETTNIHISGIDLAGISNGSKVVYNATIPWSGSVDGYSQSVSGTDLAVSTNPSNMPCTYTDLSDAYGNTYRRYIWTLDGYHGSTFDISVTTSFNAAIASDLTKVNYTDPIGTSDYPEYRAPTTVIQSNDPAIINKKNELLAGAVTEAEAVDRVMDFVKVSIPNQADKTASDASAVSSLYTNTGTCMNRAYLAIGLLRSAGIPARYVNGMLYDNMNTYNIKNGYIQDQWGNGLHAWVEVYYPLEHTWVAYDPYRDNGFVDTRHVKSGISLDGNIQDRITHGDFGLMYVDNMNHGISVSMSSGISTSGVNDNFQLHYLYTKQSPPKDTYMYAREMQYSPSSMPVDSSTPTPTLTITPTPSNGNATASPTPTATARPNSTLSPIVLRNGTLYDGVGNTNVGSHSLYNITGTVIDNVSGKPVRNASVILGNTVISTDDSGRFNFSVSPGNETYSLLVNAAGYSPENRTINGSNGDLDLKINLAAMKTSSSSNSNVTSGILAVIAAFAGCILLLRRGGKL